MVLGRIAGLVSKAGKVATDAAIEVVLGTATKAIESVNFTDTLEKLDRTFTPIRVPVTCLHRSHDVDDYSLRVDLTAFKRALNEGRYARPEIVVRARHLDLDRNLLAERLEEALRPLLSNYEQYAEEKKNAILYQREIDNFWAEIGILILMAAGAILGPLLWIIIGLEGWKALKSMPWLVINAIKNSLRKLFYGDELEQLDAEVEAARATIKKMVQRVQIEQITL